MIVYFKSPLDEVNERIAAAKKRGEKIYAIVLSPTEYTLFWKDYRPNFAPGEIAWYGGVRILRGDIPE